MRSARASLKPEISRHFQLSKPGKKNGGKIIEADGYVDNSPPCYELTTYPQPLLPGERKESDNDLGYPQAAATGFMLRKSSRRLRVDNPLRGRSKIGFVLILR